MTKKLISFDDQAEPGEGLPAAVKAELKATYGTKAEVAAKLGQATADARYTLKGDVLSVVPPNMVGAVFSKNLYNPNDADVLPGYILNPGAAPVASANYFTSGWIPVNPGTSYVTRSARRIQFYTADKTWISPAVDGQIFTDTVATAPATAAFMRASWWTSEEATTQIEEGTVSTPWVPYSYTLPGVKLPPITPEDLPPLPFDGLEVEWSKNLYNPAKATDGVFLSRDTTTPNADYTTSEFIPVTPGETYTISSVRAYNWYTVLKTRTMTNDHNFGAVQQATITAPEGAAFLRFATLTTETPRLQVEVGTEATAWEPYGAVIKGLRPTEDWSGGAVRASLSTSGALAVETLLGSQTLRIAAALNGSLNGTFSFLSASLDGAAFHNQVDDVTPIRAMGSTVGANHGWTAVGTATNPDGKTAADVGSRWTDGVREYAIFGFQSGKILLGAKPLPRLDGTSYLANWVAPTTDLTHVAGATNTGPIPATGTALAQLFPSVRNVSVTADMDGTPVAPGSAVEGDVLTVRETYSIIDYGDLYTRITATPGTPLESITPDRLVTLRVTYQFSAQGRCLVSTALTANRPVVELGQCGFVQSMQMARTGYSLWRRMPGVIPKAGFDLAAGANITTWNTSEYIYPADLLDPAVPPQFTVDTLRNGSGQVFVGFALGYVPDQGDGSVTARLSIPAGLFWDLRSTRKNYPNAINGRTLAAGETVTVTGFRAYLDPEEVGGFSIPDGRGDVAALADSSGFATVPGMAGRPVSGTWGPADASDATVAGGVSWSGGWGTARIGK